MEYILGTHATNNYTIALSDDERRRHIHIIGQTGTGKSGLLYNLIRSDIDSGRGFALIDPHGDLAEAIAKSVPKDRIHDGIYFDPLSSPIPYNPLTKVPALHRATVAAHVVSSFKHIWIDTWGPRLEYILTNAIRLLLDNNCTLTDIPRLLTDREYRDRLLQKCSDEYVRAFWLDEYNSYSDKLRAEAIAPIQNKVGQFALNPILRAIVGQRSKLNLRKVMDHRGIFIANLAKRMGAEPSHLIGALLVTGFSQAAEARADMPEEKRQDFTLYVDEFQNFATQSFANILSEARKYRLNLVLAHQYMHQVPEDLGHAVLGNTGTLVSFRLGADDASRLSKHLGVPERFLIELSNYRAQVRVLWGGNPLPFTITTHRPKSLFTTKNRVHKHTIARYIAKNRGDKCALQSNMERRPRASSVRRRSTRSR